MYRKVADALADLWSGRYAILGIALVLGVLQGPDRLERMFLRQQLNEARLAKVNWVYNDGMPQSFSKLSTGHYHVAQQIDVGTWLVFALVPGGGRDIPILVQDLPTNYQSDDTVFSV